MREIQDMEKKQNLLLERMSHELRTPMNSIIGLTYLSKENIDNPKQVLENLDKIERSVKFLRSFMDDILDLSLLESGRVAYEKREIPFVEFLEELTLPVKSLAEEKQLSFLTEQRGDLGQNYCFDGDKLKAALSNIMENAVKYTPAGGRVVFIAELLQDTPESGKFRFEVRDTGCGMSEEFLPRVFEPFEQEDEGGTTLYGGTGLGLAVSKNIIDFMGGKIDAYSVKGSGTTMVVTVELEKAEQAAQAVPEHKTRSDETQKKSEKKNYDFTGKRILLVEDNDINIEITRNILLHKNFEVDVALNGKECVDMYLGKAPGYYDVILMDIRMPVMDGLTAAKVIRESSHGDSKTVPIIAMTANVFEEDVKKSFEAGMDAHLSKPLDIRQMYELLAQLVLG